MSTFTIEGSTAKINAVMLLTTFFSPATFNSVGELPHPKNNIINNRLKENFMQKSYNRQRTRFFILVLNQIVENHLKEDIYNATILPRVMRNCLHWSLDFSTIPGLQ